MGRMYQWITIAVLYLAGFGLFGLIGGMSSAGEAFRRWGETASGGLRRAASSF